MKELAIVTGGSKGIGKCLVQSLTESTSVLNISRTSLNPPSIPSRHEIYSLRQDLSDIEGLQKSLTSWLKVHPEFEVSLFVSNAATLKLGWLPGLSHSEFRDAFAVNAHAPIAISTTLMRLGKFAESGARIIYVTSSLARNVEALSFGGIGLYSATKAALGRFASIQRRELTLRDPTISVTQVHPGVVDTSMQSDLRRNIADDPAFVLKNARLPDYKAGDWEDVSPSENMRTIPARLAADFLLWVSEVPGDELENEYDFYSCSSFHGRHATRSSRLGAVVDSGELSSALAGAPGSRALEG